ncbi:MAG: class B sortase [Clostridia bacterium]|nr:class B sortase [Clostridia bacterium]
MKNYKTHLLIFLKSVLFTAAVITLAFSSYKLYSYNKEQDYNEKVAEKVVSARLPEQTAPISVNFKELKQENNDIIAWIYCEGTPINYPVVQAEDNSYYLSRRIDGAYSASGTLFADCLNKGDFTDNNTIIYGHNMKNNTMFGTLVKYTNQQYFDEHKQMYILTPDRQYKVRLVAGATVNGTSPICKLPLENEYKDTFVSELIKKSTFKADYMFSPDDKFVMLSTCSYSYDDARYVLIGVLQEI